jgi:hypothetical protein
MVIILVILVIGDIIVQANSIVLDAATKITI